MSSIRIDENVVRPGGWEQEKTYKINNNEVKTILKLHAHRIKRQVSVSKINSPSGVGNNE